ncbi:hypothetical protein X801_09445, partial [Opisthorchis viverrini]
MYKGGLVNYDKVVQPTARAFFEGILENEHSCPLREQFWHTTVLRKDTSGVNWSMYRKRVIYDMIVGPPSMGSETDARGNQRP